jgi:biopolymer transport protein ExbB
VVDIIVAQLATIGGPVLIILFLVSVAATATTIFKVVQYAMLGVGRHKVVQAALIDWLAGDRAAALARLGNDNAALTRVARSAMDALARDPAGRERAQQIAVIEAQTSLAQLGRHLRMIEAVVQAAPMLGLLGTVIGMIEAFGKVATGSGAADPTALAGGIWIALTTTALGLAIAIPFYFISVWLEGRVDAERNAMDAAIARVTLAG